MNDIARLGETKVYNVCSRPTVLGAAHRASASAEEPHQKLGGPHRRAQGIPRDFGGVIYPAVLGGIGDNPVVPKYGVKLCPHTKASFTK